MMRQEKTSSPISPSKSGRPNKLHCNLTSDTFFNGQMTICQSRTGYRFSIDAVLLAWHARPQAGDRVLDLGTGCGIIPLIMALREPAAHFWGVDVQPRLAAVAALNVAQNHLRSRIHIRCRNLKHLRPEAFGGPFHLVVSNPPYRKAASGRINPDRQRALARHEIAATVQDVVKTASRMLTPGGRFVTLYPVDRLVDVLETMRALGIEPKLLRLIHSKSGGGAKLFLTEGIKGGRPGIQGAAPLYIYQSEKHFSDEVKRMFEP